MGGAKVEVAVTTLLPLASKPLTVTVHLVAVLATVWLVRRAQPKEKKRGLKALYCGV